MPGRAMSYACRSAVFGKSRSMPQALAAARERFDEVHEKIHGHAAKEKGVEVVSYRLRIASMCRNSGPRALTDHS